MNYKKRKQPVFFADIQTFIVFFVLLTIQINLYAQQFEAEGTIIYSTENNGRAYQKTKHFTIDRDVIQWKIRTIDIDRGKDQESSILFNEAGCDGTNIFYLIQHDTNKAYLYGSQDLTKQKNLATALGRVQKADSPPCMDSGFIYPVWLAYCSFSHLSTLKGDKVVAPLFPSRDFYTDPIPKRLDLPAKWKLNSSSFVSEINWFSDGTDTTCLDVRRVPFARIPDWPHA